jgi:hypothetical protein
VFLLTAPLFSLRLKRESLELQWAIYDTDSQTEILVAIFYRWSLPYPAFT